MKRVILVDDLKPFENMKRDCQNTVCRHLNHRRQESFFVMAKIV
jgi:hypothetical protein